jgi:hypothetical protein
MTEWHIISVFYKKRLSGSGQPFFIGIVFSLFSCISNCREIGDLIGGRHILNLILYH